MKVINKKRLLQMEFVHDMDNSNEEERVFVNKMFRVTLVKGCKDDPIISINGVNFPGAFKMKDLMDIIFFYLGEEEYGKFIENWTLPRIVKTKKQKPNREYYITEFFGFIDWKSINCKKDGLLWVHDGEKYTITELFRVWDSKRVK